MAMQMSELKFPTKGEEEEVIEVEQEAEVTEGKPRGKKAGEKETDLELEVVDDTPEADRGRSPGDPPDDVTDEELQDYSEKVAKRIKRFSKGYHDERRAKEAAIREREALEQYARQLREENLKLKSTNDRSHNTLIEQGKKQIEAELEAAKRKYKDAYEAGDTDAILEAQEALAKAHIRADKVASIKPRALQETETPVQDGPKQPQPVQKDPKAEAWHKENSWFGSNDEMTAYAIGYHSKLVRQDGVDPQSDEYYEKLNARMRKMFPENFDEPTTIDDDGEDEETPRPKKASVVAPATRSTAPKKVTLTKSEVAIANRLGVPLEEYARQVALLKRKQ